MSDIPHDPQDPISLPSPDPLWQEPSVQSEAPSEEPPISPEKPSGTSRWSPAGSTAVKGTVFLLFIVLAIVTALCVAAIAIFFRLELFTTSQETFREQTFHDYLSRDAGYILDQVLYGSPDEAESLCQNSRFDAVSVTVIQEGAESPMWSMGKSDGEWTYQDTFSPYEEDVFYRVCIRLSDDSLQDGMYAFLDRVVEWVYILRYRIFLIGGLSALLTLACFIFLLCAAGHRNDKSGIHPGWGTRIPIDLTALGAILAVTIVVSVIVDTGYHLSFVTYCILLVAMAVAILAILTGFCMSLALRIKLGGWWKNSITCQTLRLARKLLRKGGRLLIKAGRNTPGVLRKLGRWFLRVIRTLWSWTKGCYQKLWGWTRTIFQNTGRLLKKIPIGIGRAMGVIPLVWKTVLSFGILSMLECFFLILLSWEPELTLLLWFLEKLLLFPLLVICALTLRKLQIAGAALANGDLNYQVDIRRMFWDFKTHGEHLNSIASGMTHAVEQRLKSERLKTELITNVSHDIKTPLTSIINYADLIGHTPCENPTITEYAGVLLRQSERLKKLIEDLVEASKASTGNLDVMLVPCEAGVLLTQAAGEYQQRLQDANLELITRQPDHPVIILADGRRLWRVFDNLISNICKYAQSGTRVYLILETADGEARISFKNTSHSPLDMPAEELLERFTRGDAGRSTEGNGLGLSIAQSLTELQKGHLELTLDGDLFKVVLRFPLLGNQSPDKGAVSP